MTVRIEPLSLLRMVQDWDVPEKPHCSNCSHSRVTGTPSHPKTYCARGYGRQKDLWTLIRRQRAIQFIPAERCPDWDSMGPGDL